MKSKTKDVIGGCALAILATGLTVFIGVALIHLGTGVIHHEIPVFPAFNIKASLGVSMVLTGINTLARLGSGKSE